MLVRRMGACRKRVRGCVGDGWRGWSENECNQAGSRFRQSVGCRFRESEREYGWLQRLAKWLGDDSIEVKRLELSATAPLNLTGKARPSFVFQRRPSEAIPILAAAHLSLSLGRNLLSVRHALHREYVDSALVPSCSSK